MRRYLRLPKVLYEAFRLVRTAEVLHVKRLRRKLIERFSTRPTLQVAELDALETLILLFLKLQEHLLLELLNG